jgi:farnesyl-diphosphate farnesyltransferase
MVPATQQQQLSWPLLEEVSRSFYWTLRVLPRAVRKQIGLAYLLARTTDTIADTALIPVERRLRALQALRRRILGEDRTALDFGELSSHQGSASEKRLLESAETNLAVLETLSSEDLPRLRRVLDIITSGQDLDLRRFASASAKNIVALKTDEELDDYTYRVAGCVGEFWTLLCRAHLFPEAKLDETSLIANGVRFGKGLQLVNILRDLPADLRNGRCYLPEDQLAGSQLTPTDLLEPATEPRVRQVYNRYLDRAEAHLRAGWTYTNTVPRRCFRVRLACAWPILIGVETLKLLRINNVLDPARRTKLKRAEVKRLMLRSVLVYPWNSAWIRLIPPPESVASTGLLA